MWLSRVISNDVYIHRQRRFAMIRRPAGVILVLLGCGVGAMGAWVWLTSNPRQLMAGDPIAERSYDIGLSVGISVGAGGILILLCIAHGLGLLFGGRGTRLLLDCYERLNDNRHDHTP